MTLKIGKNTEIVRDFNKKNKLKFGITSITSLYLLVVDCMGLPMAPFVRLFLIHRIHRHNYETENNPAAEHNLWLINMEEPFQIILVHSPG